MNFYKNRYLKIQQILSITSQIKLEISSIRQLKKKKKKSQCVDRVKKSMNYISWSKKEEERGTSKFYYSVLKKTTNKDS